jgi:hypothetical protein
MTAAAVIIFAARLMALANGILALAGDAFVPAVSALTLGLVAREALARRSAGTRLSTTPGISLSQSLLARSATCSRSAPSFSWFQCSPP